MASHFANNATIMASKLEYAGTNFFGETSGNVMMGGI
jgi:hypothetical protein